MYLHALMIHGEDWCSGSGSMGCEFDSGLNSLMALVKLLATNVHPLDPGVNGYLFYSVVSTCLE